MLWFQSPALPSSYPGRTTTPPFSRILLLEKSIVHFLTQEKCTFLKPAKQISLLLILFAATFKEFFSTLIRGDATFFRIKGQKTSLRISKPNKYHMKQSDLGKSLDPTVSVHCAMCRLYAVGHTAHGSPPVHIQYSYIHSLNWSDPSSNI